MRKFYFSLVVYFAFFSAFSFNKNVDDTVPPVWTSVLPQDIAADCGSIPQPETLTASDDSGTVTVTLIEEVMPGSCPASFVINRTWTATDPSGNNIIHLQFVFVSDTLSPTLNSNYPQNLSANCNAIPGPPYLNFTDNCGNPSVQFNETSAPIDNNGTYELTRTWLALDGCGNSTLITQIVTVSNTPNPYIVSVVQPDCSNQMGSVNLDGLPNNSWTITIQNNGVVFDVINGTGITTSLNLPEGSNSITVLNSSGCTSLPLEVFINYLPQGITASATGVYQDYNNDGVTNVGDVINYQFTIVNNSCNPITNITLSHPNFTINGGPIASLGGGLSDTTTFTATYVLTPVLVSNGQVIVAIEVLGEQNSFSVSTDILATTILNVTDGIRLNAFLDTNSDGIQNNGEPNFNQGSFNYAINGGTVTSVSSSVSSVILYETNPSNTYALSYVVPSAQYVCATTFNSVTVPNGSGITIYNFPVTTLPFDDLAVYVTSFSALPRPGFTYQNQIIIQNQGNQTIPSGTVTFTNDPTASILTVSPPGSIPIPTGFTYNFTNLLPNTVITLTVTMQVPTIPIVSLGQQLTNTASVTIPIGDVNVSNNNSSMTQTIVGSYDPNDKQESHGGQIQFDSFTSNDYLTYTIRFENTGTANAINVRLEDVLDAQLDETSFRMFSASHNYVLERVGSNVTWKFSGIDLPPSVPDTQIGHGYVTFQIKPKTGFAIGDIIENTAEIYFDFNPAIITNTHTTEFVETLGNASFAFSNLNYFPNPLKNTLTISNDAPIEFISISSVLGQQILSQKVNTLQTEIDLSTLSNGIYFVKVMCNGAEKTVKIIKE